MSDYTIEAARLISAHEWAIRAHDRGAEWDDGPEKTLAALLAHIQRGAVPEGNERDEWETVVFTLMGHAASLYFLGQSDMPNWFYELAEKLARRHVDEALADRVREVGVQQRAMLAAAPAPDHSALSADRLWPVDGLYPDMLPPATSKERWMFDQGRLAERRIAMDALRGEVKP